MRFDGPAAALYGHYAAQDFRGRHGLIGIAETIALGGDELRGASDHAMGDEATMALEDHQVAMADDERAADIQDVIGPEGWKHAAAGYGQASLAAGGE